MKKITAFVLVICLLLVVLIGCDEKSKVDFDNTQDTESLMIEKTESSATVKQELEKFSGEITSGTPFSEGLAIISDGQKTYCINKDGGIVFKLDYIYNPTNCGYYEKGYQNGLVKIGDNLYDKTGKETKPADVGATKFYDYALSGGYIVVEKQEATYNSTKTSVGIMNTKFEWVIQLSEELTRLALPSRHDYAINGYIIFMKNDDEGTVFEIATSQYFDFKNSAEQIGEYSWGLNSSNWKQGNPQGEWVNCKHIIQFYNLTSKKNFFTLINANGEFEFEPVELTLKDEGWGFYWKYDGRYIVARAQMTGNPVNMFIYDTSNGTSRISTNAVKEDIIYSDGVVVNYINRVYSGMGRVCYYDTDLNPLF